MSVRSAAADTVTSHGSVTPAAVNAVLDEVIDAVDHAVRTAPDDATAVAAVAAALAPWCGHPRLLPAGLFTSVDDQALLHVAADGRFSLLAMCWRPGESTPVHDHVAWCVVGVHAGVESETRYCFGSDGETLEVAGRSQAHVGDVSTLLPPGDIHRVSNDSAEPTVSLHVYGADVRRGGSSVRRIYATPTDA